MKIREKKNGSHVEVNFLLGGETEIKITSYFNWLERLLLGGEKLQTSRFLGNGTVWYYIDEIGEMQRCHTPLESQLSVFEKEAKYKLYQN